MKDTSLLAPFGRMARAWQKHPPIVHIIAIGLLILISALSGCQSVEDTLSAVDYACVDIEIDPHSSDSGMLGRGVVIPEGETLTAETVQLLCDY